MSKSAIPVVTKLRLSLSLTEIYVNRNARQTILKTKQQRTVTARFGSCVSSLRSAGKGKRGILQFPPKFATMPPIIRQAIHEKVDRIILSHKVVIFSKSFCPFCRGVKELFDSMNQEYSAVELDLIEDGSDIQDALAIKTNQKTVPNVFVSGEHIGGSDKTLEARSSGRLQLLLTKTVGISKTGSSSAEGNRIEESCVFDYDLIVIGGGSGGLATAKEAAILGKKVAVCDFVKPSLRGTTWGLGGTCVNVGCIPKKLMHQAALLGQAVEDAKSYGWEIPENVNHNWNAMVEAIQNHIGSLNWGYRVALREKRVDYINAFAEFIDNHTIKTADKRGKVKTITADHIVLAMGGRPRYPKIPGAREHCITSDDLFSLPYCPGKTLLVGASYIALECAGFLAGLGLDTTVMVRSILLRGFDQQMAELVGSRLEEHRVKFLRGFVPVTVEKIKEGIPGLLKVTSQASDGQIVEEEYNTVILAIGRDACTKNIGIEKTGVKLNPVNGKVICDSGEQSSVENIFAIGDILDGRLELTPVAIQAGRLLAQRLYGGTQLHTDYINVPTTVFTPVEYGSVGLSEEDAIARLGADNIEVYQSYFTPLEFVLPKRGDNSGYAKLICLKPSEKVIGFHVLSPNAGEITQGFAVGLKLGATKADFDNLIGIHPTVAEVFTTLQFTKASGSDVLQKGC